jgi:hypothetical protein
MPVATSSNSTNASPYAFGTTVNTVSGPVFPGNPSAGGLIVINNGTVMVSIVPSTMNLGAFGVYPGATASVAVINGPGCINMSPGDKIIFDNLLATCPWNGIAQGGIGAMTFWSF